MILQKIEDMAKTSEIYKQEGSISLLSASAICSRGILSKYWSKCYPHLDFRFIAWCIGRYGGIVIFNGTAYRGATIAELKEILDNKLGHKNKCIKRFEKKIKKCDIYYKKYNPDFIKSLSKDNLKKELNKILEFCGTLLVDNVFCESVDDDMLKKEYVKINKKEEGFEEFISKMSLINFDSLEPRRNKIILEELNKKDFDWYDLQWVETDYFSAKTIDFVKNRIKGTDLKLIKKELEKNDSIIKENKEKKKRFIETLSLELKKLANFVDLVMYIRDFRKDYFAKMFTVICNMASEYFKMISLAPEDCIYSHYKDFELSLVDKEDYKEILEKRKKGLLLLDFSDEKQSQEYEFDDYQKLRKEVMNIIDKTHGSEEIRGSIAQKGKASGTVRIVMDHSDFHKFNEKDILVTSMTRQEFVPLMKKASAIVTDEGGITCHAAIVSRELKKPCIIGTKNATRVLKDDDLVEVDANKGIVKVIKRA